MNAIRPIAICVFRRDDRIFVFEGYDPLGGKAFYRPLGAGLSSVGDVESDRQLTAQAAEHAGKKIEPLRSPRLCGEPRAREYANEAQAIPHPGV
ncbi:MAG: hypothetical protein Kow00123_27080 [Anaerolineales bacterium]